MLKVIVHPQQAYRRIASLTVRSLSSSANSSNNSARINQSPSTSNDRHPELSNRRGGSGTNRNHRPSNNRNQSNNQFQRSSRHQSNRNTYSHNNTTNNPLPAVASPSSSPSLSYHHPLLDKLQKVRDGQLTVPITLVEFQSALSLFANPPADLDEEVLQSSNLPQWIFQRLQITKSLTLDSYQSLMQFYNTSLNDLDGIKLMESFEASGYPMTSTMLTNFLQLLNAFYRNDDHYSLLKSYYLKYRHMKAVQLPASFYIDFCISLCYRRDHQSSLEILEDMTIAGHEPSPQLCERLLNNALFYKDFGLLRVLASWYSKNFAEMEGVRLEYGQCRRMLEIAGSAGDSQLSLLTFQMMNQYGYPISGQTYYSLLKALLASNDLISSIEAIQEMSVKEIPFSAWKPCQQTSSRSIRDALIQCFLTATKDPNSRINLDQIYYALVDQVNQTRKPVPAILLEALIATSAKLGLKDRAFATFQELEKVFLIKPNVDFYNALMLGCGSGPFSSVYEMTTVFQDLENNALEHQQPSPTEEEGGEGEASTNTNAEDYSPNEESYTLLFESILLHRDYKTLKTLMGLTKSMAAYPEPRTLRRVAVTLAKQKMWEELEDVMELLRARNRGPQYCLEIISKRIETLKKEFGAPESLEQRITDTSSTTGTEENLSNSENPQKAAGSSSSTSNSSGENLQQ